MAKEEDQTQKTEEDTTVADEIQAEETKAAEAAVKTSEDFDAKIDADDVEETPPEEKKEAEKKEESEDKADDDDTGQDEDDSDKQEADAKDATDTGETEISKELAQKAIDLGLTEDEVKAFDTADELTEMVKSIEDVTSAAEEKATETETVEKPAEKPETKEDDSAVKFENEDDIDPEILKAFRALEKQRLDDRKEREALLETVKELSGGIDQQNRQHFVKRFDGYVKGMGIEFAGTFGTGSTDDLAGSSKAFQNRDAVRGRMLALAKAMPDVTDEQRLFDIAVNSLHKEKIDNVNGSRMSKKTTKHSKRARVGRSATRRTGTMTGHEAAVETSRNFDELIDTSED